MTSALQGNTLCKHSHLSPHPPQIKTNKTPALFKAASRCIRKTDGSCIPLLGPQKWRENGFLSNCNCDEACINRSRRVQFKRKTTSDKIALSTAQLRSEIVSCRASIVFLLNFFIFSCSPTTNCIHNKQPIADAMDVTCIKAYSI